VRRNVDFLICGLALARADLAAGSAVLVYPAARSLPGGAPYRFILRNETRTTAQVGRFADWLTDRAAETQVWIDETVRPRAPGPWT
jgi:LysR family transcriptional regulator, glycine cleavage system transcriptional activator